MDNTGQARQLIKELKDAVKLENKWDIAAVFEKAKLIDWHAVHDSIFSQYDDLVDQANDILLIP